MNVFHHQLRRDRVVQWKISVPVYINFKKKLEHTRGGNEKP